MILNELVLHNFGVYRGRHTIDLTPKSSNKPIILIGALNGTGKTTILDALKLALFGKLASCSKRGKLSYLEFLSNSINDQTSQKEGASVELQFQYRKFGKESTVRITRTWHLVGKQTKESVDVLLDGEYDRSYSDRWHEFIEEIVPLQVSNLFFFDGEKIKNLASSENSTELLRTGLHALLGLDIVDQAIKDLRSVDIRMKKETIKRRDQFDLTAIQEEIHLLNDTCSQLVSELASKKTEHQNILNRIKRLNDELRRDGGELFDVREKKELDLVVAENKAVEAQTKLRELASNSATPILLVADLLTSAKQQAEVEDKIESIKSLSSLVIERDKWILDFLREKSVRNDLIDELANQFLADQKIRDKFTSEEVYLNTTLAKFQILSLSKLRKLQENISIQISQTNRITERVYEIQNTLAAVPDRSILAPQISALKIAKEEKRQAELKIAVLQHELESYQKKLNTTQFKFNRLLEKQLEKEIVDETKRRVFEHSNKLQNTFSEFRYRVAKSYTERLEKQILECFNQVSRKSDLIKQISISPLTYKITLYKTGGQSIPPDHLSAGERQLLTISILWGLARASGRPLPAVIDTPLSRLDSSHRRQLVNNYFPFASHQVLLLSTDEEITNQYYANLVPYIGREYLVEYNAECSSSQFSLGYF